MELVDFMLASMPPYMCKCGREMGGKWATVDGRWTEVEPGCQPGHCLRQPNPPLLRDAVSPPVEDRREGVQFGPVQHMSDTALYDCPCGCGLWTSEPAKLCSTCNEPKPATHWDGLVDCCGDCAEHAYGE